MKTVVKSQFSFPTYSEILYLVIFFFLFQQEPSVETVYSFLVFGKGWFYK
jgi:hypothetical protein